MTNLLWCDPQCSFIHVLIAQPGNEIAESVLAASVDFKSRISFISNSIFPSTSTGGGGGWSWPGKGLGCWGSSIDTWKTGGCLALSRGVRVWRRWHLDELWSWMVQKLISEFLGCTGSANALRSHKNPIANLEIRWRIPMSVRSSLVSLLSFSYGQP